MISTFNLSKLNSLLQDFYRITNLRFTVSGQNAPRCRIIRTDKNAAAQCARCDAHACEVAARSRSAYTYRCHAGLTESIAPLTLGNIVIGYLFFGHVFSYPTYEEGWKNVREKCASYHIDESALKAACFAIPIIHLFKRLYCICLPHHAGSRRLSLSGTDGNRTAQRTAGTD